MYKFDFGHDWGDIGSRFGPPRSFCRYKKVPLPRFAVIFRSRHWHVFSGVAAGSEAGQMTERGVNEFVEEEVCLSFGPQQIPSITRISGSLRLGNIWRHKEKSSS